MFSKRARPYDDQELPPATRFRSNAADLFLSNSVSARRVASLLADAHHAGAQHVRDIGSLSRRRMGNLHRDLLRKLLKGSKWPALYEARVRVWDNRLQKEETALVPVMLPHELLDCFARVNDVGRLSVRRNLTEGAASFIAKVEPQLGSGPPVVPIGLWIDGTPCNWDRSESVETFALSFPGLDGDAAALRVPFAVILHKHCVSQHTFDDLLSVLVWSLRCLSVGVNPRQRHDGDEWHQKDTTRRKKGGAPLQVRGLVCEVRGDWKCMKDPRSILSQVKATGHERHWAPRNHSCLFGGRKHSAPAENSLTGPLFPNRSV